MTSTTSQRVLRHMKRPQDLTSKGGAAANNIHRETPAWDPTRLWRELCIDEPDSALAAASLHALNCAIQSEELSYRVLDAAREVLQEDVVAEDVMTVPLPEGLASLCNAPESGATAAVKLLEAVAGHAPTLAEVGRRQVPQGGGGARCAAAGFCSGAILLWRAQRTA